jgi:PST family polysaccharide transporter
VPDGGLVGAAARGAFWTVLTSSAARVVGLAGTLLLTRFLGPEEYGEVSLAAVVMMTANTLSNCGLSQYLVSKPHAGRAAAFHATFYFTLLGLVAIAAALVLGGPFGAVIHAPGIGRFLPGLALAAVLERAGTIQDRIQVRDMRFRSVGLLRSLGEIVYSAVSVILAAWGSCRWWGGGNAVVLASVARSVVRLVALSATTPRREWLSPCRITWRQTRELFAFGLPMSVATLAGVGSRKWDNLVFSAHFGQAAAGIYNLAYNLADIPATQIGETIGDVLVPSFAKLDGEDRRRRALLLSMRQITLLVAPLAFGLGAVAPSLARILGPRWASIDLSLMILSVLSVVRPIGWIASSYLQVKNLPRTIMVLETAKTAALVVLMHLFAAHGPRLAVLGRLGSGECWACAAVGLVFALSSLSYMMVFRKTDGISLSTQLGELLPPVLACAPMVAAVVALHRALPLAHAWLQLGVEVAAGGVVFVPSAFVIAPAASRELVGLLRAALARGRAVVVGPAPAAMLVAGDHPPRAE